MLLNYCFVFTCKIFKFQSIFGLAHEIKRLTELFVWIWDIVWVWRLINWLTNVFVNWRSWKIWIHVFETRILTHKLRAQSISFLKSKLMRIIDAILLYLKLTWNRFHIEWLPHHFANIRLFKTLSRPMRIKRIRIGLGKNPFVSFAYHLAQLRALLFMLLPLLDFVGWLCMHQFWVNYVVLSIKFDSLLFFVVERPGWWKRSLKFFWRFSHIYFL